MRVAFLSDAHGNAIGLSACLAHVQSLGIEQVYFLGDAVGYLPAAYEVLDLLARAAIHCQQGNHERMLLTSPAMSPERADAYRLDRARDQLSPDQLRWLDSWPTSREMTLGRARMLLVHGSPASPLNGYVYPDTDLAAFHNVAYDAVVMGHTHRAFVRHSGGKTFVNAGSVGMPRDQRDQAAFAVYDDEGDRFEIVRVALDVEAMIAAYGDQIANSVRASLRRT